MKNLVFLAIIALLSCSIAMAQSSSTTQNAHNSGVQATSPTPPGDTRDASGNTIAPDGSKTPKGSNTFGSQSNNAPLPSSMSSQQNFTPPGDRRDRYGNTIAPDGTDTPRNTNTFGESPDATNSRVPPSGSSASQATRPTPTGDRRDRYGDTVTPDGSITPGGANTANPSQDNPQQFHAPDKK